MFSRAVRPPAAWRRSTASGRASSRVAARRASSGVTVLTVNYKEAPDVIRRFLERLPFKLPILLDPDGDATFD